VVNVNILAKLAPDLLLPVYLAKLQLEEYQLLIVVVKILSMNLALNVNHASTLA